MSELISHFYVYLWNKHEDHDEGGANEETDCENGREAIVVPTQCVRGQDGDGKDNTGDVDGGCNPLGIVQPPNLHFPGGKG